MRHKNIKLLDHFFGILEQSSSVTSPAEVHGILVGLICLGHKRERRSWFDAILKILEMRVGFAPKQRNVMLSLYDMSCRQLETLESDFELLLPNEERSFSDRAKALTHWCRGFIYGLGLKERHLDEMVSEEVYEALHAISDIASLDFTSIDVSDADKAAYSGVVDYISDAVLTVYDELVLNRYESNKDARVMH